MGNKHRGVIAGGGGGERKTEGERGEMEGRETEKERERGREGERERGREGEKERGREGEKERGREGKGGEKEGRWPPGRVGHFSLLNRCHKPHKLRMNIISARRNEQDDYNRGQRNGKPHTVLS